MGVEPKGLGPLNPPEHQTAVGATKTKVVFEGHIDGHVAGLVGAIIQVAVRVLVKDIHRRRALLVVQGQHGEDRLQPPCTAQQMAGHRLGGIDDDLFGVVTQCGLMALDSLVSPKGVDVPWAFK